MRSMKISVIMPAYNAAHCIISALESIRKQTFQHFEILITNDGSTDNTETTVKQYAAEHSDLSILLFNQENKGIGAARNTAIANATGEILAFLDSDDYWYPKKLERIHNAFQQFPQVDIVYHAVTEIDYAGRKKTIRFRPVTGDPYKFLLLCGNQLYTSATSVRRQIILNEGGFSESMTFNGAEDYELWLRLSNNNTVFHYLNEILGEYRKSTSSITAHLNNYATNCYHVYSHHLNNLYTSRRITMNEYKNFLFYHTQIKNYKTIKHFLNCGDFSLAFKYLVKSFRGFPMNLGRYIVAVCTFLQNRTIKLYLNR